MTKPMIGVYNHATGEQEVREMNVQELKEWQDSQKPSEPKPLVTE
jgi:hypothetical protein